MSDPREPAPTPDDFDDESDECWQCGGEGRVAGICIDGACLDQDDPDCEFCSHACDICDGKGSFRRALSEDPT